MKECDTLLMIGSGFPYSEFLPKEGQARGVQIDIEPDMLSLRYPMEVNLVGDSGRDAARPAAAAASRRRTAPGATTIEKDWRDWWKTLEKRAHAAGQAGQSAARRVGTVAAPARPSHRHQRLRLLRQLVRARSEMRRGMMCSLSGGLASMGAAVPYAIAAKFAHPGPPGDRARRRRRDADEQHGGADHRSQILAAVVRSALDRAACSTTRT